MMTKAMVFNAQGFALYAFDLTPDMAEGSHVDPIKHGSIRMDIHFTTPFAETVNMIVYAEYNNVIQIDRARNVIKDFYSATKCSKIARRHKTFVPRHVCQQQTPKIYSKGENCGSHSQYGSFAQTRTTLGGIFLHQNARLLLRVLWHTPMQGSLSQTYEILAT